MQRSQQSPGVLVLLISGLLAIASQGWAAEDWLQWKFDARHAGDVPGRTVATPLGLVGAVPLTDAVFTAPVVRDGRVYVVDGAGVVFCIDGERMEVIWKFESRGGAANCNNVSSPALAGRYLHFGTMAGSYYVLDAETGKLVEEIRTGEPIFTTPVVSEGRVYFTTLGSRVHALEPAGKICWKWDFVENVVKFPGNRWNSQEWLEYKKGRVTWRDQFCSTIDIAADGKRLVLPCGGQLLWLRDLGDHAEMETAAVVPPFAGKEHPGPFGLCLGPKGEAYMQWHRRDNSGRVEILQYRDGKLRADYVRGTETAISLPGLMSFCAPSVRGEDVYRCRPEHGLGLCRHSPGPTSTQPLCDQGSIASPILLRDQAVYGGLDGRLHVVPLDGKSKAWSFTTAFGRPITAPVAVADGRIYFGCEDGYLYVLGPGGRAPMPQADLGLERIRTPLDNGRTAAKYDWFTNYGDLANTNANTQGLKLPLRIQWIRRYEGTFKHLPVCGGGRLYTHMAEGQIFAVEQSTGRLLWRRYFPDVFLSFTAPIYYNERLLLPQAGLRQSRLRCLDAKTGELLWEAPFSGSPSWSRQGPPVIYKNLAIYAFGSGRYAPQGSDKPFVMKDKPMPSPDGAEVMSWIYTHDNPYYPQDNLPYIRAWDLTTGREVWSKDFSEFGCGGNDCGLCLLGDRIYYSTFFGYAAKRRGEPGPTGLTAAMDPLTGKVLWSTTDYHVTAGCTLSGKDGRIYLGGYNRPSEKTKDRFIWCLDANDGKLIWQSEPVASAVNVVSLGERFIFTNASGRDGHVLDRETGKILSRFNFAYACTRFSLSEPYLLGANMDVIDLSDGNKLVSTGPPLEARECIGGIVSNGRLFYTAQASGLQTCQVGTDEKCPPPPWMKE